MFLKKKAITLSAILLCIYVLSLLSQPSYKSRTASAVAENTPQIILDAGHAGFS